MPNNTCTNLASSPSSDKICVLSFNASNSSKSGLSPLGNTGNTGGHGGHGGTRKTREHGRHWEQENTGDTGGHGEHGGTRGDTGNKGTRGTRGTREHGGQGGQGGHGEQGDTGGHGGTRRTREHGNYNSYDTTGIWLFKVNDTYELKITRDKNKRPKGKICLLQHNCSSNWTKLVEGPSSNDDTIQFNNTNLSCFKCGTPFKKPETEIKVTDNLLSAFNSSTTDKSQAMTSIIDSVLKDMGNKTSASVTMGEAKGLVVKPEDPAKLEPVSFIYSDQLSIIQDETQLAKYPTAISVPQEALEKVANKSNTTLFTSVFRFPNFNKDEKNSTVLNNEVYSIDMGAEISNLTTPVNITFRNITKPNEFISSADLSNLTYITSIGCGLSVFFLGVALFMHFLLRTPTGPPQSSVLWAASCGQRPVGSVCGAASCGAASCGQCPVGQCPVGQRPVGQRPVGQRPVGQRPVGQCPVPTDEGLEDDQHCTVQQQMSYGL
ncbi:hypothetical protein NFI96_026023 [Prochilodus magdalenae]|nr:hypothetical protein NFI96_026023 [Prochilodus magdalenae]